MRPYYMAAYTLEIIAVIFLFITLAFPWHFEHGTGVEVLEKALITRIRFGLSDPFTDNEVPVSQWWVAWLIPLIGITLGLRAFFGYMFIRMKETRYPTLALLLFLAATLLWYGFAYFDEIRFGYFLTGFTGILLILIVLTELFLPEQTAEEWRISTLPADHPDRIMAGMYRTCHNCGEANLPEAKNCRSCQIPLYHD